MVLYNDKTSISKKITNNKTNNIEKINKDEHLLILGNKKTKLLDSELKTLYEISHKEPKTKVTQLMEDQFLIWSPGLNETLLLSTKQNNKRKGHKHSLEGRYTPSFQGGATKIKSK